MTGMAGNLAGLIGQSGAALDMLMPMHLWVDPKGCVVQAGPTICKMAGRAALDGENLFDLIEFRRPVAASDMAQLRTHAGHRLAIALRSADHLLLRATFTELPDQAGAILNLSLGLSFAKAVAEFDLTLTDFSPCDQTVELMYLHEANASTAHLSRILSERLEAARAAAEEQALTDALTGLANRRAMDQHMARSLADPMAEFALLHIDLDLFKTVNDTFGHAAGDQVLSHVGKILRDELRHSDLAARVGGDEFLVMIHECSDRDALGAIATRLIAELERPIPFEDTTCQISASIGIATVADYPSTPSIDDMLADTDMALYKAKRTGRGRYCVHGRDSASMPLGRRVTDPKPVPVTATRDEGADGIQPPDKLPLKPV